MGGFFGGGGASVDLASPPAIGNTTPNTGAFTTLSANNGTITTSSPAFTLAQTWNAAGQTFTALRVNATDTASASGSLLMDLQIGGSSRFSVSKSGSIAVNPQSPPYSLIGIDTNRIIASGGSGYMNMGAAGFVVDVISSSVFFAGTLNWQSSFSQSGGNVDLTLVRDAANVLAQRRTTSAQTFRIYNTFTDASNYERGFLRWASNVFEIGAEAAGTGTARNLRLYGNVGIGTSSPGSPLCIEPSTVPTYGWMMKMLSSGLTANNSVGYILGRNESNYNLASIDFNYVGNNSTSNRISYGFYGVATPPFNILASGFVGIGTISPSTTFDINADKFRVRTAKTPASASAAGDQGDICWDSSYIYICTATNTWKRVAIATWP